MSTTKNVKRKQPLPNFNEKEQDNSDNSEENYEHKNTEEFKQNFSEQKSLNKKDQIYSLFPRRLFAELYFAWCKDVSETITIDNAKYFRDEILLRNNRDIKNFNFNSLRIGKNFLMALIGNLDTNKINKLNLADNLITDVCMHNIKNLIANKKLVHLNLASNMISSEGLKVFQHEVIESLNLKYLNLGIVEGSFRRNNFSGEGGLLIAKIILANESLQTLILQDNDLGEEAADKIGSALIQNKSIKRFILSDNKIKSRGAQSILENSENLISLDLSNNEIVPEVGLDLYKLLKISNKIEEIYWDSNFIGAKGIKLFIEGIRSSQTLKHLSIKNTGIGNPGLKLLAEGLRENEILISLDISSNSITFESFSDLCDSLNFNKIKKLKARNNLLGDESMKYFSEIILREGSFSEITEFDFSSSKIYDQGLIYILSELQNNTKINKIKLRDNYFSHEIDYVVIDFLDKNTNLIYLELTKNRFSYQCLQKIQKIIDRNVKIQNDKEPNKLLVEVYRLKYENTKLNEMKDTLKNFENDIEKIKLNRADIRLEYETFKRECDDEYEEVKRKMEKNDIMLNQRKNEFTTKVDLLNATKTQVETNLENLNLKLNELKNKKIYLQEDNIKIKVDIENMEKDYIIRIEKINNVIEENKRKENDYNKITKGLMEEIIKLDKIINLKKNEGNIK